jgi:hypothetical protein
MAYKPRTIMLQAQKSYIPEIKMQNFKKILVEKQKTWESYNRAF